MSRMFATVTKTWNPFVGCHYLCYHGGCWARLTALRLKHLPRYQDGFKPKLIPEELRKKFEPGEFVAVSLMGDICWATLDERGQILAVISKFPQTWFLTQSKNPYIFLEHPFANAPDHLFLGTTIETNRTNRISIMGRTLPPCWRLEAMLHLARRRKFLSIEPIMDFDLDEFTSWIGALKPDIIEIGADNYHNNLPEPSWDKVESLVSFCQQVCPDVKLKKGLERLRG